MADNISIDTGLGLASNRRTLATVEDNNVHTLRTDMSVGGSPVDGDNPLPVSDADALAELAATNAALTLEIQKLSLTLAECVETRLDQIVSQLELITDTVFTPEDVEDRDAYY